MLAYVKIHQRHLYRLIAEKCSNFKSSDANHEGQHKGHGYY